LAYIVFLTAAKNHGTMSMSRQKHGTDISDNDVISVGSPGFGLLINAVEYFVSFNDYPRFKQVTVEQIFQVKYIGLDQLYWPDLDVDLS